MEERRYDDEALDVFKDLFREDEEEGRLVDWRDIKRGKRSVNSALKDKRNKAVVLHKPGEIIQLGCRSYKVAKDGSWRRIEDAPEKPSTNWRRNSHETG